MPVNPRFEYKQFKRMENDEKVNVHFAVDGSYVKCESTI